MANLKARSDCRNGVGSGGGLVTPPHHQQGQVEATASSDHLPSMTLCPYSGQTSKGQAGFLVVLVGVRQLACLPE